MQDAAWETTRRFFVFVGWAKCVAAIVLSPSLVRVACHSPRQMRLANGLCLAVEAAEGAPAVPATAGNVRVDADLVLFPDLGPAASRRADRR